MASFEAFSWRQLYENGIVDALTAMATDAEFSVRKEAGGQLAATPCSKAVHAASEVAFALANLSECKDAIPMLHDGCFQAIQDALSS